MLYYSILYEHNIISKNCHNLPCYLYVDLLISLLVHGNVFAWALQQLLLCLPFVGYCHGCQDSAHYLVLSYTQWQTGKYIKKKKKPQ